MGRGLHDKIPAPSSPGQFQQPAQEALHLRFVIQRLSRLGRLLHAWQLHPNKPPFQMRICGRRLDDLQAVLPTEVTAELAAHISVMRRLRQNPPKVLKGRIVIVHSMLVP